MLRVGKTRPLPGHSIFGSIGARKNFILACLHPQRSPTREAVCRSSGKTRHGAYLKYTQNIVLQHQGEDPTATVDFLHHENPPTWAGVEPAALGAEGQRQTNHALQPAYHEY
ncbi:hypothetical protein TNCV_454131 [Trichonephila clavipes]|nr:hypothetical protein TNCV_454131 [Trichonephila clavipes]